MIVFAYTLDGRTDGWLHLKVRFKGNYYVVGAIVTVIIFYPPQDETKSIPKSEHFLFFSQYNEEAKDYIFYGEMLPPLPPRSK